MANSLDGCVMLVTEDEPLIAAELVDALEAAGAHVHSARRTSRALKLIDDHTFHGAVIDGQADALCKRLEDRNIPYVIYSGLSRKPRSCERGLFIPKPIPTEQLVEVVTQIAAAN